MRWCLTLALWFAVHYTGSGQQRQNYRQQQSRGVYPNQNNARFQNPQNNRGVQFPNSWANQGGVNFQAPRSNQGRFSNSNSRQGRYNNPQSRQNGFYNPQQRQGGYIDPRPRNIGYNPRYPNQRYTTTQPPRGGYTNPSKPQDNVTDPPVVVPDPEKDDEPKPRAVLPCDDEFWCMDVDQKIDTLFGNMFYTQAEINLMDSQWTTNHQTFRPISNLRRDPVQQGEHDFDHCCPTKVIHTLNQTLTNIDGNDRVLVHLTSRDPPRYQLIPHGFCSPGSGSCSGRCHQESQVYFLLVADFSNSYAPFTFDRFVLPTYCSCKNV